MSDDVVGISLSYEHLNRALSRHVSYWSNPMGFSDDCYYVPKSKWREFVSHIYADLRQGCPDCGGHRADIAKDGTAVD